MKEEEIDIELNLGKELADKLTKMNKKELLNRLIVTILKSHVQAETIVDLEKQTESLQKEKNRAEDHLDKAEHAVEQARAMIEGAMDRWYHYSL